ncbi:MAG: chorismate mutase [Lachnospiraceae bacterium]|nr:chorismate mutase [Lachnospiraceae bacterium]
MMNLDECRMRIDQVDTQLMELLKERFLIVGEVAAWKEANHVPVYDAAREEAKIIRVRREAGGEELADYCEEIFRAIMAASRHSEEKSLLIGKSKKTDKDLHGNEFKREEE